MDLTALIVQVVVGVIFVAPVLWLAGRLLVGKSKARFSHAAWIVVLGVVIGAIVGALVGSILSGFIMFVVWLWLIKHFFETGWVHAVVIAIVAVVIFIIIVGVLAVFGIGVMTLLG